MANSRVRSALYHLNVAIGKFDGLSLKVQQAQLITPRQHTVAKQALGEVVGYLAEAERGLTQTIQMFTDIVAGEAVIPEGDTGRRKKSNG